MKKVLFSILIITLAGCETIDRDCIRGEGPVVTQELQVADFDRIVFEVAGNLQISQGQETSVTVISHSNVISRVNTSVNQGVWRIGFRENCVRNLDEFTVIVETPAISGISLDGSGNITGGNTLVSDDLSIDIDGSGNITLEIDADVLDSDIDGSGNITLTGTAGSFDASIDGSGNILAFGLTADDCEIRISGSGSAQVFANNTLDAFISGSGSVIYRGNPVVSSNITGSGTVNPDPNG